MSNTDDTYNRTVVELLDKLLKSNELILAELQIRNDDAGLQLEEQKKIQKKMAPALAQTDRIIAETMQKFRIKHGHN